MLPVAVNTVACGGSTTGAGLVIVSLLQAAITAAATSGMNFIVCICISLVGAPFVQRTRASAGTPLRQLAALTSSRRMRERYASSRV